MAQLLSFAALALFTAVQAPAASKPASTPASRRALPGAVSLKVGDPAPPLKIEKWLKGSPVEAFPKGKVTVVEFWSPASGESVMVRPHMSALQRALKEKGVTVIGVFADDPRVPLADVETIVKEQPETFDFTVALDKGRETTIAYVRNSGQVSLPCAFIVDGEGKLVSVGHSRWLDDALAQVLAGTWDPVKGSAALKAMETEFRSLNQKKTTDPKGVLAGVTAFETKYPNAASEVAVLRFESQLVNGDYDGAWKTGRAILERCTAARDPYPLNEFVWRMVDPVSKWEKYDLDLAMEGATKACEFTKSKDGAILDTLARIHFKKGDVKKAIEIQEKAVEYSLPNQREEIAKSLDEYKKAAGGK